MINGLNVEKITETVEVIQGNESLRDVHVQAKSPVLDVIGNIHQNADRLEPLEASA